MSEASLSLTGISKAFAGIHAVRDVTLSLVGGHVLGLVGQNGAGKSTLMNIVGGVVAPDAGSMQFGGTAYAPKDPADAIRQRIAFIHQELNLFPNLSIAENIFLSDFPTRRIGPLLLTNARVMAERTRALLQEVSLDLPPETCVARLSPGERQLVEVAKALRLDARLIIFDEPTTSLTARETERLFAMIGRLREAGKTMIYISHILPDVLRIVDDITVLRDGELVSSGPAIGYTISAMITQMVGRSIEQLYPSRRSQPAERVVLSARGLGATGIISGISFDLRAGEVLGLFGLMGSGRTELARIVFGLETHDAGEIFVNGRSIASHSPRQRIRNGLAFVTENRREEGLLMNASVAENMALAALPRFSVTPAEVIEQERLREASNQAAQALRLKAASLAIPAKSLSGGNQQKVVLAKWLLGTPSVFILDEPTRGIDVGAKYEIYSIIDQLALDGRAILLISSELDELMAITDRILVMNRGEIVATFSRDQFNNERILAAAFREPGAAA